MSAVPNLMKGISILGNHVVVHKNIALIILYIILPILYLKLEFTILLLVIRKSPSALGV